MSGPLTSLKVLDFSTLLPGPFGTMILADMGADVIRVESLTRPDMVRMMLPQEHGVSAAHGYLNRSKKSLGLDLKKPGAVELIKTLVKDHDIVVEQFRPGVMDRLGVGYEALKAANPDVIYCSITGYGQTGPYKDRAGHDMNYLSIAGVMAYNGRKTTGPAPMGLQIADVAGGSYHGVMGILAAVIHRQQGGGGQYIDVSMTDAAFSMQALAAPAALGGGLPPELETTLLNGGSFYDCYETSDGRYFSVAGLEPQFFAQFCQAIGHPEWASRGLVVVPEQVEALKNDIAQEIKSKTYQEWSDIFVVLDSCTEPVLSFEEACRHPHIIARELLVDVPAGEKQVQRQMASPIKFSKTQQKYSRIGARLGEHTVEILKASGFSEIDIAALKEAGAIR
ncbi:MAG: carnitine dehydratase [Moraxellaceae bacterium]|nr:MAG: carnitine dehydratase [Moraxellaceae bacterium]